MSAKQDLQKLIQSMRDKKYREGEAKGMMSALQQEQTKALQPVLEKITADLSEKVKEAIASAVANIKVDIPKIEIPPIDVKYPEIPAPVVHVAAPNVKVQPSQVQFPEFPKYPEFKFPERMNVLMDGVDAKRPLPVLMMGVDGKPFQFTTGASGGKGDYFTIKGFGQSAFAELTNPDGRLKVEMPSGSSGLTDTELRASSVPVSQVSGFADSVNVVDAFGSTAVGSVFNADNRIRVSVETGGSGLTDAELRASSIPVEQVSGSAWSVYVKEIFGSTAANVVNPDGRLKVELPTGSSGLTDSELRASSVPVEQVSGSVWSTYITGTDGDLNVTGSVAVSGFSTSVGATILNGEGLARDSWLVSDITNSVKAALIDSSGVQYSGSNPLTIGGTVLVSDITASVKSALVDSTGVQYSGSNPLPVSDGSTAAAALSDTLSNPTTKIYGSATLGFDGTNWERIRTGTGYSDGALRIVHATDIGLSCYIIGSSGTTAVVGDIRSDVADTGMAPVKIGGIARQANPTAVAAGDRVSATFDDLGRQVFRPHQVRDLIATAYVSLSNGTETTLLAGAASTFHDCLSVVCANQSNAAVYIDLRCGTAGAVIKTIEVPANGTAGVSWPVGFPMPEVAQAWTVDMDDITGTTVDITALFSKEV